jgi:hypothetical protein
MREAKFGVMALAVSLLFAFTWSCGSSKNVPLLEKETIKSWISDREIIILDVRASKDWNVSGNKIKGAVCQDPDEVGSWAAILPQDKRIVIY